MTDLAPKTRSNFARLIALIGIAALLLVGGYRAAAAATFFRWLTVGTIAMYLAWILSEFRVTSSEASKDTANDRYTCESYAIARSITVLAAFGFESIWSAPGAWLPFGLSLFLGGIALRTWAIRTLGQFYSHRVRTPAGYSIVTGGPYRLLRHPAYAGMLLAHLGLLILFFNWFVLVALFAVFVPALVRRIRVEETHLLAIPEYRAFAATRARLAPGVW